ncbi:hypothetical protein M404DRAFT_476690 [Pisolithus tinctorius Marx 270]|uniref:Uncharacterized protein n=1 Tax=Pisolithus tinctorius Marx 270 TaxID=870435 RepID=A0A0C3PY09_PISTI|nr:hypothetical protein M404DRAFT_476690 [Pisolithus tinctorius Marx 270]
MCGFVVLQSICCGEYCSGKRHSTSFPRANIDNAELALDLESNTRRYCLPRSPLSLCKHSPGLKLKDRTLDNCLACCGYVGEQQCGCSCYCGVA